MKTAAFLFSLASIGAIVACSSTSTAPGTKTDTNPTDSDGGADAATPPATPPAAPPAPPATPPAPPGECSTETSQQDCVSCCSKAHEAGATTYMGSVLACMCVADKCQTQCDKTLCNETTPTNADATCASCISAHQSACASEIQTACQADTDCVAFDECVGKSDCLGKK